MTRFVAGGPDIPDALITLQEKGQTIFFCGAGVSRNAGLPLFRELTEGIYEELGEDWAQYPAEREGMRQDGRLARQYDRVLRSLERRLAASDVPRNRGMRARIRAAIRTQLRPRPGADYVHHSTLLRLSRDQEGSTRILTTNFDTLFERAWFEEHRTPISSYAGPAMPAPNSARFAGVLHLHGCLSDERAELALTETDLVLTSAEFGDAYLRSGWASRYVYDIARVYSVVLVGYEADDPPMRYLLEALEADRERYPDIRQVYAFAVTPPGEQETVQALWRAKGVEPILYELGDHHGVLYATLTEWARYADDPTAWRREQLRDIFARSPGEHTEGRLNECVSLLSHGDASQLLGELSPTAEWFPVLLERNVFARTEAHPGDWLATRLSDPDIIRNCAAVGALHERARWAIDRAIERVGQQLPSHIYQAWSLILSAKRRFHRRDVDDSWYLAIKRVQNGRIGHDTRQLVKGILQPQLHVGKPYRWPEELARQERTERVDDLLRIEFACAEHPPPTEILQAWPKVLSEEIALFRVLERALIEALEEASDVGYLDGYDRASSDVPSVAAHQQNAYHYGFYPITRALADLWDRIADSDIEAAKTLAAGWQAAPFLLIRRLHLNAMCLSRAFDAHAAAMALEALDDRTFWISGAQVEIMKLLTTRWREFSEDDCKRIEGRLRRGMSRDLFPADAVESEEQWSSIWDSSVSKRLGRIARDAGNLSEESRTLVAQISSRHPNWVVSPNDRDDFHTWHESGSGPQGHPDHLAHVSDDRLVAEAMRLQKERFFEEGDLWRLFCSADPLRALRGLQLEAQAGRWEAEAWLGFLWESSEQSSPELKIQLAELMSAMPDEILAKVVPSAVSWLRRARQALMGQPSSVGLVLRVWDRFAEVAYRNQTRDASTDGDVVTQALNAPGGILAWMLLDCIVESKPRENGGIPMEYTQRLDRVVNACGLPGLYARVMLTRSLAYLNWIDQPWTAEHLIPLLSWDRAEAASLWEARATDHIGLPRLFNEIRPAMLAGFEQGRLTPQALEGLIVHLLTVALWHQKGQGLDYGLTPNHVRRALSVSPAGVRHRVSWQFWRMMGSPDDTYASPTLRWRGLVGPVFQGVWPLDAQLRDDQTSRNLVLMCLECDGAFEEAAQLVVDLVVPVRLYQISSSLPVEQRHAILRRSPKPFLRLLSAMIDPAEYPMPDDLDEVLRVCRDADQTVINEAAYVRLFGLRRQRGA